MRLAPAWLLTGLLCLGISEALKASELTRAAAQDSTDLSLEQLINLEVTSASKRETRLDQSPAAIYVTTQADIRRSGRTNIPELLRTVPGLSLARIDASKWPVNACALRDQYATNQPSTTVRDGDQLGKNLFDRAQVKNFNRDNFVDNSGKSATDDCDSIRGGVRLDWDATEANEFTLQGDYFYNHPGETGETISPTKPSTAATLATKRASCWTLHENQMP